MYKLNKCSKIQKRRLSHKHIFPFLGEMLFSDAYVDLSPSARDLLHCFAFELKFTKSGKRNRKFKYTNNGQVSYTEIQFKEEFGYVSNTYITARNQLIKNGFIKQTYRGGMCRGDMSKYEILITRDLPENKQRWRRYPEESWEKNTPKSKNTLVGVKTRFKKKATLKNSTLREEIHP